MSYALECNPRGILWERDELAGLFLDMDKYQGKEGATQTRLMSAYNSGPWKVNRSCVDKTKNIPHATLSIFGTIQPKALTDIFSQKDLDVGFIPRFLFAFVDSDKPALWTDNEISQKSDLALYDLIETCLEYYFDENAEPIVVKLEPDAKKEFVQWYNQVSKEAFNADDDYQVTFVKKLHAQCLRLALIAQVMDDIASESPESKFITVDNIHKAIRLVNYFRVQQQHILELIVSIRDTLTVPVKERVAEAIVGLEHEIDKSMLPTEKITEAVNEGLNEKYHIDCRAVGKAASSLGLESKKMPDGKARGIVIQDKDIERLKILMGKTSETSETSED